MFHASPGPRRLTCAALALLAAGCGGGADPSTDAAQAGPRASAQAVAIGNAPTVIINEVMASNFDGALDENADVEDWVELYNTTAATVDLSGWGLSNKADRPFRWVFPTGAVVYPHGYLRVWLSKKDRSGIPTSLHTNFNLDNGADSVVLTAPNGTVAGTPVDQVALPLMRRDVSYCRLPNGTPGAAFLHCSTPSPGFGNYGTAFATRLARPALSLRSGVYATAQSVSATGPAGATLRYTVDGSEPVATSTAYTAPIAVAASTVLRVAAFRADAAVSPVETATYIVEPSGRFDGQQALFVTMSPSDMGLYKAGGRTVRGWPAHIAMTAPGTGGLLFNANTQASDSGQIGSRNGQDNVPLDIKFKDALGDKSISAALFADKPARTAFKHLKLRNSGDDYWYAHLRDGFWQSLLDDRTAPGAAQQPVHVFTNGKYYGMMDLREKEDETLIEATYGIDKDFVQFLSDAKVLGGENTTADYNAMRGTVTGSPMALAANYAKARSVLDVENFAQDFALHMFAADRDWLWRNMQAFHAVAFDDRWRFRPHDLDISSGGSNAWGFQTQVDTDMNDRYGLYDGGIMMNALLANPDFRRLYINVVADQLNSVLAPAALHARLDRMVAQMQPYMAVHWATFTSGTRGGSYAQWQSSLTKLRDFIDRREGFYDQHTRTKFALGARQALGVSVSDPAMGTVKVNTLDLSGRLSAASPTWTGRYYPQVPVTLQARPAPGYRFVGWQGGSTATTPEILVSVAAGAPTYHAVFAPAASVPAPTVTAAAAPSSLTGDLVTLDIVASDPTGHRLTWSAKKLPSGLDIHPDTGRIFGKPTKAGSFATTVTVSNGKTSTTVSLPWTVGNRGDRVAVLPQDVVGDGTGLQAGYFTSTSLAGTPALSRIELPALSVPGGTSPAPGFTTSNWSVRWEGYLESPLAGAHMLKAVVNSDDAVRVYVGGTLVIDNWTQPSTIARQTGTATLAANTRTPVRIEFMDPAGAANLQMQWQMPGSTAFSTMPLGVFSPTP